MGPYWVTLEKKKGGQTIDGLSGLLTQTDLIPVEEHKGQEEN